MINTDFLIIDTFYMVSRCKYFSKIIKKNDPLILSFLYSFEKILNNFNCKKIIMPFDDYYGNSFRKKLFPQYKENRKSYFDKNKKDDFRRQKDIILDIIRNCLPVYSIKYHGCEADDIISFISKICSDHINIVIWSNDMDFIQLQQKFRNVKVWSPYRKAFLFTPNYDIVSYKSIVGDKSDNIPGINGIGHKKALKILQSYDKFIECISSNPDVFMKFYKNKKLIDLIDNELKVPDNLSYVLSEKVFYDEEFLLNLCEKNNYNKLIDNWDEFTQKIKNIKNKTNENLHENWFFNKGIAL